MNIKNIEQKIKNWAPNQEDFSFGRALVFSEDYSKVVKRNDSKHYSALLYSILSLRESFSEHKEQFNKFLYNGLSTAESIINNREKVEEILKKGSFPNRKIKSVFSTAEKWNELNLTERIRKDKEKILWFRLREEIYEKMLGVGYKFASLFLRMSGYENIVPVDTWTIQYIESRGFKNRTLGLGLQPHQYLKYEKRLAKHAKKFGVLPALFQATIYAKFSTWKKDSGIAG